jgi:hypothetical protein
MNRIFEKFEKHLPQFCNIETDGLTVYLKKKIIRNSVFWVLFPEEKKTRKIR